LWENYIEDNNSKAKHQFTILDRIKNFYCIAGIREHPENLPKQNFEPLTKSELAKIRQIH